MLAPAICIPRIVALGIGAHLAPLQSVRTPTCVPRQNPMIEGLDRFAVAARLRTLLAREIDDLDQAARRLGVDDISLRLSIDDVSPHPTIEVIVAAITRYGVDPSWLLNGVYDRGIHLKNLDGDREQAAESVRRLLIDRHVDPQADAGSAGESHAP
jgi:hypothetical protein